MKECSIYIVQDYMECKHNDVLATVDMHSMDDITGWTDLFKDIYERGLSVNFGGHVLPENTSYSVSEGNEVVDYIPDCIIHDDNYGNPIKYAAIEDVYNWCKEHKQEYRRIKLLYKMLECFMKKEWQDMEISVVIFYY